MPETRTVVIVQPAALDYPPVHYDADDYGTSPDRTAGALNIVRGDKVIATRAPGTWQRATITEDDMVRALHAAADKVERDERQHAADTRDRERVETIVLRQWETAARATVDAALASLGAMVGVPHEPGSAPEFDVAGFWATLTEEQQAEALAPALELYRAGRDDQKEDDRA